MKKIVISISISNLICGVLAIGLLLTYGIGIFVYNEVENVWLGELVYLFAAPALIALEALIFFVRFLFRPKSKPTIVYNSIRCALAIAILLIWLVIFNFYGSYHMELQCLCAILIIVVTVVQWVHSGIQRHKTN